VSEGRGLGEERLGGRRTEEREESGGAGQILTDDGAPVLGRAMGMSALEGGAWLRWLRRGREEKGEMGMGWRPSFVLKSGSVARAEREKRGSGVGGFVAARTEEGGGRGRHR
jgi:hypothetical protein